MQRPKVPSHGTAGNQYSDNIGILVLCQDNSETVLRAINSAVKQGHPHKYIAIINDGSKDNSENAIRSIFTSIQTDTLDDGETFTAGEIDGIPSVLISHDKIEGAAISKNKGIMSLWQTVQYFTIVEATSTIYPNKVAECLKVMTNDKHVGIVYHDMLTKTSDTQFREFVSAYDRNFLEQNPFVPIGGVFSKQALETSGGFENSLLAYEDWDLWLRITEHYMAVHLPIILGEHILNKTAIHIEAAKIVLERLSIRQK